MYLPAMKRGKVTVQAKLVVGYWELISIKSGAEFSALQDTSTLRVEEERRAAKKQRNYLLTEANWPRLMEALVDSQYPYLRG